MVNIIVDNRLRFDSREIPGPVLQSIRNAFTHKNPQYHKIRSMGYHPGKELKYIRTFEEDGNEFSLPRGGTMRLREVLRKAGIAWNFDDWSYFGGDELSYKHRLTLYDYQREAVEACFKRRNCLLRSPTGSGKTTIGINLIAKVARPTLVIVWSSALAKQWIGRLEAELGIPKESIGVMMGGRIRIRPITIGMQQTIYSRGAEKLGVDSYFSMVIADEVQRFAAPTFRDSIEPFKARYRIGISADETRNDGKEFLIYDVFGRVAYEIGKAELANRGYIHDVEVRVIPTEFRADWYHETKDFLALTDSMALNRDRNDVILRAIEMALDNGTTVMVFSHRVEHCRAIDSTCAENGIKSGLMLGNADWAKVFDETKKGLQDGSVKVAIGTNQAIGQGIDVPVVDRGVIATPITSNRQQFNQMIGRVCRTSKGKDDAIAYYLWDRHVYGLKTLKTLRRWNKKVLVWDDGTWVNVDTYLKQRSPRRQYGTQS